MIKELVVAVVGGGVVALAGYLLVITKNQVNISHIQSDIMEIKEFSKKNSKSLVATKLFIAQAHPDRDASSLASLMKLQKLDDSEVEVLAGALPDVKLGPGPENEIVKMPVQLKAIVDKHQLNGIDIAIFWAVANLPVKDGQM